MEYTSKEKAGELFVDPKERKAKSGEEDEDNEVNDADIEEEPAPASTAKAEPPHKSSPSANAGVDFQSNPQVSPYSVAMTREQIEDNDDWRNPLWISVVIKADNVGSLEALMHAARVTTASRGVRVRS
jgi:translation initiation factor IF-2